MKITVQEKTLSWLWLSVFIIVVDQWTKYLVVHHYSISASPIKIFSWLNLTLSCNTGAAFSFLSAEGGWQIYFFALISLVVSVLLIAWLLRIRCSNKLKAIELASVIGGALGNFIDRIHFGCVIDFIDFHIKNWHYATFNIADSAIFLVAFSLMISVLFTSRDHLNI